jgi:hypothetical protein
MRRKRGSRLSFLDSAVWVIVGELLAGQSGSSLDIAAD